MAIQVKLPDGAVREYEAGTTIEEVAGSISPGLRKTRSPARWTAKSWTSIRRWTATYRSRL
ncbi:hypothetical protein PACILC2_30310 [Paenibacillus cisolokensis]|uniref:TGS domain-containing protein n=1 Tax=Paenibacillus cisolokensis TaxID=1658519 RepID=A0ABQ4N876_9BACL|nr:hypothetical protein PACILC2_30310 [Paenibacillus cisolokensis]